jgi:hypothetical protein
MAGMQRPDGFWDNLERVVSAKVESALRDRGARREPVIEYLRHLEEMVRSECDRRQTVQIIASGRSLLGDRAPVAPRPGSRGPASSRAADRVRLAARAS